MNTLKSIIDIITVRDENAMNSIKTYRNIEEFVDIAIETYSHMNVLVDDLNKVKQYVKVMEMLECQDEISDEIRHKMFSHIVSDLNKMIIQ